MLVKLMMTKTVMHKIINMTIVRYGIVGVFNTLLYFSILFILMKEKWFNLEISTAIATIASFIFHFFCNKFFTFQMTRFVFKEILKYIQVCFFNYFISIMTLNFFLNVMKLNVLFSTLITTALVMVMGFWISKYWIFKMDKYVFESN